MEEFVLWGANGDSSLRSGKKKNMRKPQLNYLALPGGVCITKFVHKASKRGVLPAQEELTTLTTLKNLKAEAGNPIWLYSCEEHEDSELYEYRPGNVKVNEGDEHETELLFAKYFPSTYEPTGVGNCTGEASEPRLLTDKNTTIRRIQANSSSTLKPLSLSLALESSLLICGLIFYHRNHVSDMYWRFSLLKATSLLCSS